MNEKVMEAFELFLGGLALALVSAGVYRALANRGIKRLGSWLTGNVAVVALVGLGFLSDLLPIPLVSQAINLAMFLAYCCYSSASLSIFGEGPPIHAMALTGFLLVIAGFASSFALGVEDPFIAATAFGSVASLLFAGGILLRRRASGTARNGPGLLAAAFGLAIILQAIRAFSVVLSMAGQPQGGIFITDRFAIETSVGIFLAINAVLVIILMTSLEAQITARLEEGSRERTELQLLYDAFAGTAGLIDPAELFHKVLDLIQDRLKADAVVIYLEEREGEGLTMAAQRGLSSQCLALLAKPDSQASIAEIAFAEGKPVAQLVASYEAGPLRDAITALGLGIAGAYPIVAPSGIIGTLMVGYRDPADLDDLRRTLLETLSLQLGTTFRAAILHAKLDRANARLSELASTDVLTNLANRRAALQALDREIARARRSEGLVAVIMGDLDRFKGFNDRFGHDCGDYVLMNTAAIISDTVRATDIPSRWGGEEFLIVLGESEPDGAFKLAERLRQRVEASVWEFGGRKLKVTMTLGVALVPPAFGAEAVINLADEALYQGKRSGRNKVTMLIEGPDSAIPRWPSAEGSEAEDNGGDNGILEVLPCVDEAC
ncbi:MAG TPA: sensor domain-containing diguanylate cyclase [Rectinemataceae bacterium]|nr:sensor domain-containing diguanylate cyclase [Rectinemataceae bacterium]